jgi:hypothetical protein
VYCRIMNRNEYGNHWGKASKSRDYLKEDKGDYNATYDGGGGGGGDNYGNNDEKSSYTLKSSMNRSHVKNPYDDLDNLSSTQLLELKRKNKMTNNDLMPESEINWVTDSLKTNATKARKFEKPSSSSKLGGGGGGVGDDFDGNGGGNSGITFGSYGGDDDEITEKEKKVKEASEWKKKELAMIRQFLSFNINSTKKVHGLRYDIKQGSTEEKLLNDVDVFNNITELLMAPLTLKIRLKQFKHSIITPLEFHREHKTTKLLVTNTQYLQENLALSYSNATHLTFIDFVYLLEKITNSTIKKVIVHSENGRSYDTAVFSFEWQEESLFVFMIAFKMSITYAPSSSRLEPIYLYRQDIVNENDDDDTGLDDFFEQYTTSFRSLNTANDRVLHNGTKVKEDLLVNIIFSYISYLHYGYAPAALFQ